MAICAVIDSSNQQINLIVADPADPAPIDCRLVEIPNGFYWDGSQVSPVPEVTSGG
jgi:hypothetical protein